MIYIISNQLSLYDSFEGIEYKDVDFCIQYFSDKKFIGVDTETTGFDVHTKKLLTLQLGNYEDQFYIDNTIDISIFKLLLEDKNKVCLFHNAKFDLKFLFCAGIHPYNIYDTFLAECVLTAGYEEGQSKLSLKDVCEKYVGVSLDKSVRGEIHKGLSQRVIDYASNDVKYLERVMECQMIEINKWELNNILDLENSVVKVFALMEYNGIGFDVNIWKDVAKITGQKVRELEDACDEVILNTPIANKYKADIQGNLFFDDAQRKTNINWSSPIQKLKVINELGIKIVDTMAMTLSNNQNKHPLIPLLVEYNRMSKLSSSFGLEMLKYVNPITNRIHSNVWQILSTGRISMEEPNLLQIPSKGDLAKIMRSAFIPKPGYKIVGGDYQGFELSIIAEFSEDPIWVDSINNGGNLHSILCAKTFNIPIEDVKNPFPSKPTITYRDVQKTLDFGLSYGMSKFKLSNTLQISIEEAEKIIKDFFSRVPMVDKFLTRLGNFGKKHGYIVTPRPMRRIRWFPKWDGDNTDFAELGSIERKSKNMPIQSTNGNCIKMVLVDLQNLIDENNYPVNILLSVYDEIQTECREDFAEEWLIILKKTMLENANKLLKIVKVEADCKIADCWTK